ncbi:disulfide bond formation protein [Kiloniella litopenaei]|uniref:Disulfide bond formation protein n=1 Tax=Kiloniella litopenaei TaxID=1549748 RepID=A0A0M2RE29_9PROT|nr:disulfide bond formation protein B [Kiloniella litopenaei]KKJ77818.1 disulfide bond formation protein [Kiloniella litopenaei]
MAAVIKTITNITSGWMALIAILSSAAVLAAALAFQYIGGLYPCVLCMYQRWAYVVAAAFALLAWIFRKKPALAKITLGASSLSFFASAVIAGFHVGVEKRWWEGTSECQGAALDLSASIEDLTSQLMDQPIVRCDVVPWDLFGISMAGYNIIISLVLTGICLWAIKASKEA